MLFGFTLFKRAKSASERQRDWQVGGPVHLIFWESVCRKLNSSGFYQSSSFRDRGYSSRCFPFERSRRSGTSKSEANTAVDDATFEWRPSIDGPPAVKILHGPDKPVITGLTKIGEIFGIEKETHRAETPLEQDAKDPVGDAVRSIGILIQPLPTNVIPFEADSSFTLPLPEEIERCRVPRR